MCMYQSEQTSELNTFKFDILYAIFFTHNEFKDFFDFCAR